MKKILLMTAAVGLLMGTAIAAPDDNDHKHQNAGHGRMASPARGNAMSNTNNNAAQERAKSNVEQNQARARADNAADQARAKSKIEQDQARARANNAAAQAAAKNKVDRDQARARANNNNNNSNNNNFNRNNNNNRKVDLSKFRRNVTAPRRFHAQAYRGPSGYRYQRWSYGQRLPTAYWARNYWLTDFLSFGLMTPPSGYTWVRYGSDAILIDEYTGDIVQVEYNVFY